MTDLNKQRAMETLLHYFRECWPTGKPWSTDNESEIRGIVEDIIEAAQPDNERVRA